MMIADEVAECDHLVLGPYPTAHAAEQSLSEVACDLALIDIDLLDGRTGGSLAAELSRRGCPVIFITGQVHIAQKWSQHALGVLPKPVSDKEIKALLYAFEHRSPDGVAAWPERFQLF